MKYLYLFVSKRYGPIHQSINFTWNNSAPRIYNDNGRANLTFERISLPPDIEKNTHIQVFGPKI
jgi:hypothetical protein